MRLRTIVLTAPMLLATGAFNASFAQTTAVSEHSFDWIFFAIVGIPFVLVIIDTVINDGWRPRNPDGVERGYPRTVSNASATKPLSTWRTPEEQEVPVKPEADRTGY